MRILPWLIALLLPSWALGAVEGRVRDPGGDPIVDVRIDVVEIGEVVFSGDDGRFSLVRVERPARLRLSHPCFVGQEVDVSEGNDPLDIRLEPKPEVCERVVVSAHRSEATRLPGSVAASAVDPQQSAIPPATTAQLVSTAPGVSQNGQGGLFQVYSVRGTSRQRVQTLLSGARIVSDRRAGPSTSFIDPLLLDSVEIVRGAGSTYFGSGALGGVTQMFPRSFDGLSVQAGVESQGTQNYQVFGWGGGPWSVGLARRSAGRAETPDGEEIASAFDQYSASLGRSWSTERHAYDVQLIAGVGRDIEKASTDFPERHTTYDDDHLFLSFGMTAESGWSLETSLHVHELDTQIVREGVRRDDVVNSSADLGAQWQRRSRLGSRLAVRYGVDYFGRRRVDSIEESRPFDNPDDVQRLQPLRDGQEDELGIYGGVEWSVKAVRLSAGLRGTWQRQQNAGAASEKSTALNPYAGVVASLGQGVELSGSIGTGIRFPSLSERFYSGATGRGGVIGNPDLDSESAVNVEAGVRWFGENHLLAAYLFRNDIDDYIERVEVENEEDLLTWVNLRSGQIRGVELEASYRVLPPHLSLEFGGHLMEGRGDDGLPLNDVPSNRVFLGATGSSKSWSWQLRFEHRSAKNDPGTTEKKIPAAELLSAGLSYRVLPGLELFCGMENLLDEVYFNSADDKVPLAPGRSVAVGLSWSQAQGRR